jgi:hypothetical protein
VNHIGKSIKAQKRLSSDIPEVARAAAVRRRSTQARCRVFSKELLYAHRRNRCTIRIQWGAIAPCRAVTRRQDARHIEAPNPTMFVCPDHEDIDSTDRTIMGKSISWSSPHELHTRRYETIGDREFENSEFRFTA